MELQVIKEPNLPKENVNPPCAPVEKVQKRSGTDKFTGFILRFLAVNFNHRGKFRKYLIKDHLGKFINFTLGFRTANWSVEHAIAFQDGHVKVLKFIPPDAVATMVTPNDQTMKELLMAPPDEKLNLLYKGKLVIRGNLNFANLFNFYVGLVMGKSYQKKVDKKRAQDLQVVTQFDPKNPSLKEEMAKRGHDRLTADKRDPGVQFLEEPYLSRYTLADFPRLQKFVDIHFTTKPVICPERAKLLTDWFIANGFETEMDGKPWVPELRQGHAFKYLLENRKPLIRTDDLIAGTTTSKEIGVVIYPDGVGTMIWGELKSARKRILNPYDIYEADLELLHHHVFPFWFHRNFKEYVREKHNDPICEQIDDRFAVYFLWKTVALSHTIPDFPKIMAKGTNAIIQEIQDELAHDAAADQRKKDTLQAMVLCLEGLNTYAKNLSIRAAEDAKSAPTPKRRMELERLTAICAKVPVHPAETLHEAINAMWITWVGLHMENTNAGLSLGRLDQWLQPYFASDIAKVTVPIEREAYIKKAIELVGCFYMRCTDHLPLIPDIGNYLFGGSSSDQAITLGGITPDGKDAVCDMTYIFLKVTEMLNISPTRSRRGFYNLYL